MPTWLLYTIIAVASYCLGSISVGILLSRYHGGPDLHTVGSGSTGASNVLRTMGTKMGVITLLGDFLKAVIACGVTQLITHDRTCVMIAGLACVIGHNWPIYHGFAGGKGVSSSCGVMLVFSPLYGGISILAAIAVIALTRFISLGSMVMLVLFAILVTIFVADGSFLVIAWAFLLAAICIWRHRSNIQRLIAGKERKIGQKEKTSQP